MPVAFGLVFLAAGCTAQAQPQPRSVRSSSQRQHASGSSPRASIPRPQGPCHELKVTFGEPISPVAGEEGFTLSFENASRSVCSLQGYPEISLFGANGRLPFAWIDGQSPGPYFLRRSPGAVVLAPGHAAHVLVAKYRCDLGDVASAKTVAIRVAGTPGQATTLRLAADLSYCRGGPKSPGNTVGVTQFVTSISSVVP